MKKKQNPAMELLKTPLSTGQTVVSTLAALLLVAGTTSGAFVGIQNSSLSTIDASQYTAGLLNAKKDTGKKSVWDELHAKGLQGEHYTLNIHGKGDSFGKSDCSANTEDGTLGNNIFIPSNGDSSQNNQIIMQSGNAKGKWASTNTTYGVLDACTATFDGDAAELTIPSSSEGYYVVARVLGKPTNDPSLDIEGELQWVQDELGNDLLVLGLVTDNGFETPDTTLTRTKGKVKSVDITGLFEWNGDVCYFDTTNYCYDEAGAYTCTDTQKCCADTDGDGIQDDCMDVAVLDDVTYCDTEGYALATLGCQSYTNEWVFNIGDFVGYMWNLTGSGDFKLANIRFYPVK